MSVSAEEFLQVADLLPMPMMLVAADGTILAANQAMEAQFGLVPAEVTGRGLSAVVAAARDAVSDYLRICARSRGALPGSFIITASDGRKIACRCEGSLIEPSRNGAPGRILLRFVSEEDATDRFQLLNQKVDALNQEIAKRTRVESALRTHNERLRLLGKVAAHLLSASTPQAVARSVFEQIKEEFRLDGYFNYFVNEVGSALELESYAGVRPEVAHEIGRLAFDEAFCGSVAAHREPLLVGSVQESDDPRAQLVKSFGIRAYACFPMLAGDKLLGTLSFTSRRRDRFDDEEAEFLQTISYYTTLAYQRLQFIEQLREGDRHKDEFLATLAHELRNPLAPIANALELMRHGDATVHEQAHRIIERQLKRMVRLIDDLLEISRISRGQVQLRKERVGLGSVLQAAVEATRPLIEARGHQLKLALAPQPVDVDADPTRLTQVFANLLDNAAKYTDAGGHIWLSAETQPGTVVVSVRDTGVGIAAEHLPRVFQMFSQITPALERSQGGLGIGLSLVKRIVELHGGSVEAHSRGIGMGSQFTVRLPAIEAAPAVNPAEPERAESSRATPKCRILVVDDNADAADSLALMLQASGHEVERAYDGLQAVQAAATFRPHVILLDIGLPKLNGYEAARQIRQTGWGRSVGLIALTGWGQDEDRRRTREAGFDHHIVKPIDPDVLERLLANFHHSAPAQAVCRTDSAPRGDTAPQRC